MRAIHIQLLLSVGWISYSQAQLNTPASSSSTNAEELRQYESRRNLQWLPEVTRWDALVNAWESGNFTVICESALDAPSQPAAAQDVSGSGASGSNVAMLDATYAEQLAAWDTHIFQHKERMYSWQLEMRSLVCSIS